MLRAGWQVQLLARAAQASRLQQSFRQTAYVLARARGLFDLSGVKEYTQFPLTQLHNYLVCKNKFKESI